MPAKKLRIGILGDFNPDYHSHHATNVSIKHAAQALDIDAEVSWVPTLSLLQPGIENTLAPFDALWASPGSPYKSMAGMLAGIECARHGNWPFLAT